MIANFRCHGVRILKDPFNVGKNRQKMALGYVLCGVYFQLTEHFVNWLKPL